MEIIDLKLKALSIEEINMIQGGSMSEVGRAVVKFLGMCFMNPGAMAAEGAAAHEIMGFK
jgi:hypothetical protein